MVFPLSNTEFPSPFPTDGLQVLKKTLNALVHTAFARRAFSVPPEWGSRDDRHAHFPALTQQYPRSRAWKGTRLRTTARLGFAHHRSLSLFLPFFLLEQ